MQLTYGMMEMTTAKRPVGIQISYMGSMSSRMIDVEEAIAKALGRPNLAKEVMERGRIEGSVQYALTIEVRKTFEPRLYAELLQAMEVVHNG